MSDMGDTIGVLAPVLRCVGGGRLNLYDSPQDWVSFPRFATARQPAPSTLAIFVLPYQPSVPSQPQMGRESSVGTSSGLSHL